MSSGEQAAAGTSGAARPLGAGRGGGGGARPLSGPMTRARQVNKKIQQNRKSGQIPQQQNYASNNSVTDADESLREREREAQSEVSFSSYKIIC